MPDRSFFERVTLDSSVLLGAKQPKLLAAADLSWLLDRDDLPVFQTALAAGVPGTLLTDNNRDFPVGEVRNGMTIVTSTDFLRTLHQRHPDARPAVACYLSRRKGDEMARWSKRNTVNSG